MAKKLTDIETKKQQKSFYDLADENVERRLKNFNQQAEEALFDNTHSTKNLNEVYDEIDAEKLKKQARSEDIDVFNPFFGETDSLEKLKKRQTYKQVVSKPETPVATIEIKEDIKPETKIQPKTKRKKLWFVTGAICIALFAGLFTYNMININSLAKKAITKQYDITQQQEILEKGEKDYQQRLSDLDVIITDGMQEAGSATEIDLSAKNDGIKSNTHTNFWDKVCNFFANLFGR